MYFIGIKIQERNLRIVYNFLLSPGIAKMLVFKPDTCQLGHAWFKITFIC